MTSISDVLKVGERAVFIQEGEASPAIKPFFRGETTLGGFNTPQGDVTPVYLPDRSRPNEWVIVDTTQASQGLATSDFTARVNNPLYKKWKSIVERRCPFTLYIKSDDCGAKDAFDSWQTKSVYVRTTLTDFTEGPSNVLQGDDQAPFELTGSLSSLREYFVIPIKFEEVGDATLLAEAIDGFYTDAQSCGGRCGRAQDACEELYVLTALNAGSPGLSSRIVYTTDNAQTFDAVDIPTLGAQGASAMGDAGSFVIVVSENDAAHHYIRFSDLQNGDASAWTRISTNYTQPGIDVYVKSSEEIFIAGNAGYAYKLDDVTSAPSILTDGSIVADDLRHVDGVSSTVVFAGQNGKVLVSQNDGDSLTEKPIVLAVDGSTLSGNVTALSVIGENTWLLAVGGKLYYTLDGGDTYTEKPVDSGFAVINDIRFFEGQVGYLAAEKGGQAVIYRTHDAGYSWQSTAPDIEGLPTAQRISFVAPCGVNEVAAGGRVAVGDDGILAIAV